MENEVPKTNIKEVTFPEESGLIIEKILEDYGLKESQEKEIEQFLSSSNPREREEIFENLPGTKIAKLVKDYAMEKIVLIDIPKRLEKELTISHEEAEEITKDLKDALLDLIDVQKETSLSKIREEIFSTKTEAKPSEIVSPETPEISSKKDIYREPIE